MATSVIHQADQQRFIVVRDGQECVLEYRLLPDHGVDFTRTFVPVALRGQGIAESLVRTGIGWAREQSLEITASCWYVSRFLKRRDRR
jgi:hypothetical protein